MQVYCIQHVVCDAEKALNSYRMLLHIWHHVQIETVLCCWDVCLHAGWWHVRIYLAVT